MIRASLRNLLTALQTAYCPFLVMLILPMPVLGQPAQQSAPPKASKTPGSLVQSLYGQVLTRRPTGIPYGEDAKYFAPYLSRRLRQKMDIAVACGKDWYRQNSGRTLKPPFAWLETGLFSGQDERTDPDAFDLERTEAEKNGSIRVYVKLQGGTSTKKPWVWHVAVVVVKEDGHFAVDDVIYLKDQYYKVDSRLTETLMAGCKGPHWVGFSPQP